MLGAYFEGAACIADWRCHALELAVRASVVGSEPDLLWERQDTVLRLLLGVEWWDAYNTERWRLFGEADLQKRWAATYQMLRTLTWALCALVLAVAVRRFRQQERREADSQVP